MEEKDIYNLLQNAHLNWAMNSEERFLLKKAFSSLVHKTKCIYANLQNRQQAISFCLREEDIT